MPRWVGIPAPSPWSPGEPRPRLRARTERKGRGGPVGVVGSCRSHRAKSKLGGRWVPSPRRPKVQAASSRGGMLGGAHRRSARGAPLHPCSPSPPEPQVCVLVPKSRAELPVMLGRSQVPPQSDEPLLGRQLEVGGRRRSGTHLLLAARPVCALGLPLLPKFPHQQGHSHGHEQHGQQGEDHNDGRDGTLGLREGQG